MTVIDDVKDAFEVGVMLGKLQASIEHTKSELEEARNVIRRAESMVNGYADNDHRIAVEVLRPYLARFP